MSGIQILYDSNRGRYIPQAFYKECFHWHDLPKDFEILSNPDNDYYWAVWDDVLSSAYHIDEDGHTWTLYQDGDLFAICDELMTEEEKNNFYEYI